MFKRELPQTRVIIDCTELHLETPSEPQCQKAIFSTYKNHNTAEGLVGVSPPGDIIFVSELYAGNTCDQQTNRDCSPLIRCVACIKPITFSPNQDHVHAILMSQTELAILEYLCLSKRSKN